MSGLTYGEVDCYPYTVRSMPDGSWVIWNCILRRVVSDLCPTYGAADRLMRVEFVKAKQLYAEGVPLAELFQRQPLH